MPLSRVFNDLGAKSCSADAPADLFYRYNDCVFTALYVDAKQTKGNGCADQYG